ncbi:MAG: trypsin-like peptidase domain-containing protein, partial [Oscillospiraceae bacterium]|nr:trypsin-like peptidase domain-containing protein [Oscillospiraceae bacterium]
IMNGSFPDEKFAGSLKKVLSLAENTSGHYNKTIEKNLAASLIFWCSALLPTALSGRGKFICSGNIRQKEYLFCCLAFFYGYDVMILLPEGDLSLPSGLLDISSIVTLGECRNTAVPEYSRENVSAGNAYENYHVNLSHPSRRPVSAQQTGANIRGNINAVNSVNLHDNSSENYHVNLDHPKRRPINSQQNLQHNNGNITGSAAPKNVPSEPARPDRVHTAPQHNSVNIRTDISRQESLRRPELTFEELAQLAESVVMIETEDSLGNVTGSGSGVVIDSRGYILTNCHVACQSKAYRVRMENDNCIYRTDRLLKYHPNNDLAVIRIDRPMKPLKIYSGQKELVRGQKVVAIGSPHGLFNSVSDGIISGLRVIDDVDMIQFTAPISGGSSGGALLNMYGEIIGICTASLRDSQNINIAVSYKQLIPFCQGFISADSR